MREREGGQEICTGERRGETIKNERFNPLLLQLHQPRPDPVYQNPPPLRIQPQGGSSSPDHHLQRAFRLDILQGEQDVVSRVGRLGEGFGQSVLFLIGD
jgi:hypothetical protein